MLKSVKVNKTILENGSKKISYTFPKRNYAANGQPFDNRFRAGMTELTVTDGVTEVKYEKRAGGTYVYSNNPEMLASEDVGEAILRTEGLSGSVFFTFEHSNHTGEPFYLGYQLKNTSDCDITVTVKNIGLQVEGEWLGQRSWSDFYNYRFELPVDYFLDGGEVNPIYVGCDYVDYTPTLREPVSFCVPAGEYIYVLGGTSADAYGRVNVFDTADRPILNGKCANGAVLFDISGGTATGTFYCYTDAAQVKAEPKEQGYVTYRVIKKTGKMTDYSKQYKGVDPTAGLIESELTFVFDDSTQGRLPVRYKKLSDPDYAKKNTPYAEYRMRESVVEKDYWYTSLNPNSCADAIGSDMMIFNCIDTEGNEIVIDNNRADASGDCANTGNWMVQYTDNFTLVNAGSRARRLKFFKRGNNGVLFVMARDEDGGILTAKALTGPYSFDSLESTFDGVDKSLLTEKNGRYYFRIADGRPFCDVIDERSEVIEITVEAGEAVRLSIDANILGNSCGGIKHWIEID